MTDLIKRLQEHNDERLYKEADLLMREAANAILAAQAEVNVKHEALAYSVELFKMVVRHLPGQQITWIKSGDEPDINAALATPHDLSALSLFAAQKQREVLEKILEPIEGGYYQVIGEVKDALNVMLAELDQAPQGEG